MRNRQKSRIFLAKQPRRLKIGEKFRKKIFWNFRPLHEKKNVLRFVYPWIDKQLTRADTPACPAKLRLSLPIDGANRQTGEGNILWRTDSELCGLPPTAADTLRAFSGVSLRFFAGNSAERSSRRAQRAAAPSAAMIYDGGRYQREP